MWLAKPPDIAETVDPIVVKEQGVLAAASRAGLGRPDGGGQRVVRRRPVKVHRPVNEALVGVAEGLYDHVFAQQSLHLSVGLLGG